MLHWLLTQVYYTGVLIEVHYTGVLIEVHYGLGKAMGPREILKYVTFKIDESLVLKSILTSRDWCCT